jgi:DNA polymerase V
MCSKSFSSAVYSIDEIITALAEYTQEAIKRMREDNLSCKYITVFLMTNPYSDGEQYSNQSSAELPCFTSYYPDILGTAISLLKMIYRPNYKYRKVMINLTGLRTNENSQLDLFDERINKNKKYENIMKSFDTINNRYGRGTITLGSNILAQKSNDINIASWEMKRAYLSPEYTTKLSDIPKVK